MSIYTEFIEANYGYDVLDVLQIYENIFELLGINISDNSMVISPYNSEDLQNSLKRIILDAAQEEGIIPPYWDLDEYCDEDDPFNFINFEEDEVEEAIIVRNAFEEWCGLSLNFEYE